MKDISVVLKGAWCHSYPNKEAAPNSKNHRFVWGRRKRKLTRLVSKAAPTNSWSRNQTPPRVAPQGERRRPNPKENEKPSRPPLPVSLQITSPSPPVPSSYSSPRTRGRHAPLPLPLLSAAVGGSARSAGQLLLRWSLEHARRGAWTRPPKSSTAAAAT
jgi:hypothetical protein